MIRYCEVAGLPPSHTQTGNSDVMDQLKKMDATTDMHHSAHLEQMEKAALERKQITAKLEQHTHTQREQVS